MGWIIFIIYVFIFALVFEYAKARFKLLNKIPIFVLSIALFVSGFYLISFLPSDLVKTKDWGDDSIDSAYEKPRCYGGNFCE